MAMAVLKFEMKVENLIKELALAEKYSNLIGPGDFIYHSKLGGGSFGSVFLVQHKETKKLFAMKI